MTYDEFRALPEDEQRAAFIESGAVDDLTAERDSLRTENESLQKQIAEVKESERKTKEMNYTLSRKLNIVQDKRQSAEEILNEMFK